MFRLSIIAVLAVVSVTLLSVEGLPQIFWGNSWNVQRGNDVHGSGSHGAKRGSRIHKGVDIACPAGGQVYAPCDGKVVREARPYGSGACSRTAANTGVYISCSNGESYKMFYVRMSVKPGKSVKVGNVIGTVMDLERLCYEGIINHVHIENSAGTKLL